jgi:quinol monooxygenase YgiN
MIIIAGHARVRADRLEEAQRMGAQMAALSRAEAGCADYRFSVDLDDHTVFRLFELWESPEALEAHFGAPHFAAFNTAIAGLVAEPPQFTRYEISVAGPLSP